MTLFTQHVLQLPVKIQEDSVSGVFKRTRDDYVPEISLSDRTGRSTWKSIHPPFTPPLLIITKQKQRKLEEEKRKRDEEEAAKVYKEFVEDFGDGEDGGTSNVPPFVSGGTVEGNDVISNYSAGNATGSARRHFLPPPKIAAITPTAATPAVHGKEDNINSEDVALNELPESSGSAKRNGKIRSIDLLLEDLKKDQARREKEKDLIVGDQKPLEAQQGIGIGNDVADQGTTNVFVGNLAPDVDESMLLREFGRFGPIASVKVMWPRDEEQRLRGRNTGFVCFMRREDAEDAKQALDGVMLREHVMTLGWGKPVPLPKVPIWPLPEGVAALPPHKVNLSPSSLAGAAAGAAVAPESTRQRLADGPPPKEAVVGRGRDIEVTIPVDSRQRFVIDAVACYVLRDGCAFEQAIMSNEKANPEFAFLFDTLSPEHIYYRWRLYSLSNGDSLRSWRVDPFLMIEDSNRWIPPPMTLLAEAGVSLGGDKSSNASKRDDASLPDLAREKLLGMLQQLTVERKLICDAMVFVLDHAEYATKISEIIIDSVIAPDMSINVRIARLFLLSDILYNTSAFVRNASKYRSVLQAALPDVFEGLQEAYRGADGRLAQELLRKHVLKVLKAWRGWYIFSDDFVNGLQATFLRGGVGPDGTSSTTPLVLEQAMKSNPELLKMLNKLSDVEVEMKCKHNGLSRRGGREAMVSRLLVLDFYLHGDRTVSIKVGENGEEEKTVNNKAEDGDECITKRARNR